MLKNIFFYAKIGDLAKRRMPPPLAGGDEGEGVENLLGFIDSSPSPQRSPVEGEGSFLTFYEIIKIVEIYDPITEGYQ